MVYCLVMLGVWKTATRVSHQWDKLDPQIPRCSNPLWVYGFRCVMRTSNWNFSSSTGVQGPKMPFQTPAHKIADGIKRCMQPTECDKVDHASLILEKLRHRKGCWVKTKNTWPNDISWYTSKSLQVSEIIKLTVPPQIQALTFSRPQHGAGKCTRGKCEASRK